MIFEEFSSVFAGSDWIIMNKNIICRMASFYRSVDVQFFVKIFNTISTKFAPYLTNEKFHFSVQQLISDYLIDLGFHRNSNKCHITWFWRSIDITDSVDYSSKKFRLNRSIVSFAKWNVSASYWKQMPSRLLFIYQIDQD